MHIFPKFYLVFSVLLLSCCLFLSPAMGAVPQMINYQGTLTDKNGVPVQDGSYTIEFNIYDVPTGGASLWTEKWDTSTVQVVTVGGIFNAMLGAHSSIATGFFSDHPVTYLGIKVGSDSEMLPRQRITSVGYAFTAGNGIPKGGIIMWSGALDQVPEGWALCNGETGTPDLRDRFVVGAGGLYGTGSTGGSSTINLAHSHTVNSHTHAGVDHLHTIYHEHYVSRVNDSTHNGSGRGLRTDGDYSGYTGWFPITNAYSGAADRSLTSGASSPGTNSQLSATQDSRPPYYALAFIMKL